jgi:hypothetical protein
MGMDSMHKTGISIALVEIFIKGVNEIQPNAQIPRQPLSTINKNLAGQWMDTYIHSCETNYGILSSCGMFFRFGGAAFKHLVRSYGVSVGIDNLDFRLLSHRKRLLHGTEKLIHLLESWHAAKFALTEQEDLVEIVMSDLSPIFSGNGRLIWKHFLAGIFHDFLYWGGGGKQYPFQIIKLDDSGKSLIVQFRILPVD